MTLADGTLKPMSEEQFESYVREGIEALPVWVREKLVNVMFLVRDVPSKRQRLENNLHASETLFGVYEGVPLSERGIDPPLLPDTITIFKQPIIAAYEEPEDVRTCIHNTIWHEVAHYFGHDEEWVAEEEMRRGKIL